jgi:hypothetical protein
MRTPYADRRTTGLWLAAAVAGSGYGLFLIVTAPRVPSGPGLTGQFWLQPAVKALAALGAVCYAASLLLITAGFFFGRVSVPSATSA